MFMKLYTEYEKETGKILSVSNFERDDTTLIEFDDYNYLDDFGGNGVYDYKIVDEIPMHIEEDEQRELYPFLLPTDNTEKTKQEATLNQMMMASACMAFLNELPDEDAINIPLCFDSWDSFLDGYEFKEGKRVEYKGGLWKCKKAHEKQSSWYPGAEPTLWEQLDKDEHAGTQEDPIPVPDSVTTSGFTYIYGKYYSEADQKYLFKRGGIPDEQAEAMYGQSETLFFPPSALVGSYSVIV